MSFVGDMLSGGNGAGFKAVGPSASQTAQSNKDVATSMKQQKDFIKALQAQGGLGNQTDVYNQLSGVAAGTGPNPAQAMLAQATGQNTANQAALMAGQRGSSANAGMIARQAAMQGAANQQNAVGQGATLQANQSLGALQGMGNMANTMVSNQQGALNQYGQQATNNQGNIFGLQQSANSANANIAAQNAQSQANMMGNIMGAAGTVGGFMVGGPPGAVVGGQVGKETGKSMKAEGGPVEPVSGPRSVVGRHFHMMAKGGNVPAMVSPGEQYLDKGDVQQVKSGANPLAVGERIPGKPKHPGNNYANDVVPKDLEAGGIVIPNSIMQSKDAAKKAAKFVEACLAKNKSSLKKGK